MITHNQNIARRVLIVGLDGATFDLIRPWAVQGLLPRFQRIMAEGAWGPLRTVIPPLTGPAWISFMTGKNPGTFMDIEGKSCTYGVTLIKDAPNRDAAVAFLSYMLDPSGGLKVLKDMGQPPFVPCRVPSAEMKAGLPALLKALVEVKD